MASQSETPNLSRRRLLQAAAIVPAVAIPTLAVGSPANAAYRGTIVRDEVMNRARNWFTENVQYDQGSTYPDIEGTHRYRTDCSGFVSMAWHTSTPGHSTRSIPDIAERIQWDELKPGDVLNSYDNHCMLYHMWEAPGWIWIYDLATPASDMRHIKVFTDDLRDQNYIPRRYRNIRDN
jgi:cell wall-associated NlpC family hydrolase